MTEFAPISASLGVLFMGLAAAVLLPAIGRLAGIARIAATYLTVGLATGCVSTPEDDSASRAAPIDYARQIQPILEQNCYSCHGPMNVPSGKLRLDDRDGALRGGRSGQPAIIPGDGVGSPLVIAISGGNGGKWRVMPPRGARLRAEQVELMRRWIDQGALFDANVETSSNQAAKTQIPK